MKKRVIIVIFLMLCNPVYGIQYFEEDVDAEICTEDGKPIIRMFSQDWCGSCEDIRPVYYDTVRDYHDQGLVLGRLWQIDNRDDLFTPGVDGSFPNSELMIFIDFNPQQSYPTFVFGCKYYLIGTPGMSSGWEIRYENEFIEVMNILIETGCSDTCESLNYECGTHTICDSNQDCGTCPAGSDCVLGFCVCEDECGERCGMQTVCGELTDCGACPCLHAAENQPCDSIVDTQELGAYISLWRQGSVQMFDMMAAVNLWKNV